VIRLAESRVARLLLLLGLCLAPWNGAARAAAFDPSQSDSGAIAIADQLMGALGGEAAWSGTRCLQFAFAVERGGREVVRRTHLWDRYSGRLRYEGTDKAGRKILVLLDTATRQGQAFRDAQPLEGEQAAPLLEQAYGAWINDMYWLLMPYKMKDPGVHLRYEGEVTHNGAVYDKVLLTFDKVGLTPGDRYWAHINRKTHLMDRWEYILQDDPPGQKPTEWAWTGWTRKGSILLSTEKTTLRQDGPVRIHHPVLEVYPALPDAYFTRPEPLPARLAS